MMAGVESNNSSTAAGAGGVYSSPVTRTASPPWTQIVRGAESDAPSSPFAAADQNHSQAAAESVDDNAGGKKPAWSKQPSSESGGSVVMGAELWPALSESTKASPKLSPSNSSKSLPDLGSLPPPQKPTTSNASHNVSVAPSHGRPTRQKSMKRDGGGSAQANGSFSHQHSLNREGSHNYNSSPKTSSSEGSGRDNMPNHSYTRNPSGDHSHTRNSFRRGNGGPNVRGDGSHQHYGMRRGDQDRGSHDWNHQRNFNARDAGMQPRGGPRAFVRPRPVSVPVPFVHPGGPAPIQPFMNPIGMPDMQMYYLHQGMPIVAHLPPQMYFPVPDPQLQAKIASQIDYYFSNENLIKDTFLRTNMDKDGWVPIRLIAGFKKVKELTENTQLILDVIRSKSSVLEVKGDKVRRRDDYMRWVMPSSMEFSPGYTRSPSISGLSAHIQNVRLDDDTTDAASMSRSSSGDLTAAPPTKDGPTSSKC